ncbi:MAG: hypothetical protein ACP5T5_02945 [Thermoprotei archaeon]
MSGMGIKGTALIDGKRVYLFECDVGKSFNLTLLISGLDNIKSRKHAIDDHLIFSVKDQISIESEVTDPKCLWIKVCKQSALEMAAYKAVVRDPAKFMPQHYRLSK